MKKYITTLILVVLFVGLLGYFYFYESDKEDTAEEEVLETTFTAFETDTGNVKGITIEQEKNVIKLSKSEDGSWKITKPKKSKASNSEVERILASLGQIEGKGEEISYENLKDFGLDEPHTKVILEMNNGEKKEINFGDFSISGMDIYVKTSDGDFIFLTEKLLLDTVVVEEDELKEKPEK
jgi:hypothetical protein